MSRNYDGTDVDRGMSGINVTDYGSGQIGQQIFERRNTQMRRNRHMCQERQEAQSAPYEDVDNRKNG